MDEKKVINKLLDSLKEDGCDLFEVMLDSFEEIKDKEYSNYLEQNKVFLHEMEEQIFGFKKEEFIAHLMIIISKRDKFLEKLGLWNEFIGELKKESLKNPMKEMLQHMLLTRYIKEMYDKKENNELKGDKMK